MGKLQVAGYSRQWSKARAGFLREHPLCAMCAARGLVTEAAIVDHIKPHRGDAELFWDPDNWQPLCKPCHDRHKQRAEKSGVVVGCGQDGLPLSATHHWLARR